ncbi:MAG: PilX N-terminal domain-containing pilus assembly protein [Desulfobulbaceae bacterium]|nr:PilX N-terminal domain-containing pilus assembly protein [Desulfobulbaceae bacterium]
MNMRKQLKDTMSGEEGFVLVLSLVIMGVLVIIGSAAMQTAIFEQDIAGNDARQRQAFYRSDAGLDIASEVLEQELACKGELTTGFNLAADNTGAFVGEEKVYVFNTSNPLWLHEGGDSVIPDISTSTVDMVYPYGRNDDGSVTIMTINGTSTPIIGGALQMGAGYMGKGRGAASGGTQKTYYIYSKHVGATGTNINATTMAQWRHVVGSGGGCIYGAYYTSSLNSLNTGAL